MDFGELVRKLRTEKGLTQKQCGERIGIDQATWSRYEVHKWEKERTTVARIVEALAATPEEADHLYAAAGIRTDSPAADNARLILLGKQLRTARVSAGIPIERLAATLGLAPSVWESIERGQHEPGVLMLERAAVVIGVPVSRLLDTAEIAPQLSASEAVALWEAAPLSPQARAAVHEAVETVMARIEAEQKAKGEREKKSRKGNPGPAGGLSDRVEYEALDGKRRPMESIGTH